jgi:hypothetical protein
LPAEKSPPTFWAFVDGNFDSLDDRIGTVNVDNHPMSYMDNELRPSDNPADVRQISRIRRSVGDQESNFDE